MSAKQSRGFTFAELLISLGILGIISTFTIPKLFNSSVRLEKRFALARETFAALSDVNQRYVTENGNCYPGLTCNGNHDGLPDYSALNSNPGPVTQFIAYLDSHLNYTQKYVGATSVLYQMPNGSVVRVFVIQRLNYDKTVNTDMAFTPYVYVDTTLNDVLAGKASTAGIDAIYFWPFLFRNGVATANLNQWYYRMGYGYDSTLASVFDWKEHSADTCLVVGGSNCGY